MIHALGNRERIRRCLMGQDLDRAPWFLYFGPWTETEARWRGEIGGPVEYSAFGFDAGIVPLTSWVNFGFCPAFPYEVLQETPDRIVFQDSLGIVQESIKGRSGIPRILRNPVATIDDWRKIRRERLDPEDPRRFPANWATVAASLRQGDAALQLGNYPYGMFGTLRDLMGVEPLLISFLDDPELVMTIMSDLADFWLSIYGKICRDIPEISLVHMWEDMSGKQGSLISPEMVRTFMVPQYRRLADFALAHDIPGFIVDTDGRCDELIEPFMEGGVNALLPFEVAAGNDVVALRRQFPDLTLFGGIDKRLISQGREVLEQELQRIRPLLSGTRYIPALDHLVPPEVSWQDFCDYSHRLHELVLEAGS